MTCPITRNPQKILHILGSSVAMAPLLCQAAPAFAQTAATPKAAAAEGIDEIVVTAQKREQSLIDVPAAVSALSGDKLAELGVQSLPQISSQVPNFRVTYTRGENSIPLFTIRGVRAAFLPSALNESSIAVYQDEVFQGNETTLNGSLFDTQRVEVLRGPQGTVFGKNTTGGLVHFISNRPTDVFSGFGTLQYGSDNQVIGEGAVSGPISDRVRFRLSGKFNRDDGHYRNRYLGAGQNGVEKNNGDTNLWGIRGIIEADPTDRTELTVIGRYNRNRSQLTPGISYGTLLPGTTKTTGITAADQCTLKRILNKGDCISLVNITIPGAAVVGPQKTGTGITNLTPDELRIHARSISGTAILTHDLDWAILTSVTNYTNDRSTYNIDADAGPTPSTITGGQALDYLGQFKYSAEQVSQELRLNGSTDAFDWVTGAFFYQDKKTNSQDVFLRSAGGTHVWNTGAGKSTSYAFFGQLDAHLSDAFTLSIGGRYTNEKRTLTEGTTFATNIGGGIIIPLQDVRAAMIAAGVPVSTLNKDFTGKISLSYQPDDLNNYYVSFSRGIKGAGFNTGFSPVSSSANNIRVAGPVGQEVLDSYEIGAKNRLFDRTLSINTAAFYYDYNGKQENLATIIPGISTSVQNYLNVGSARIYGLETEILYQPSSRIDFNFSGGWVNAKIVKSDVIVPDPYGTPTPLKGKKLTEVPEFSFSSYIAYHIPVSGVGRFTIQPAVRYQSEISYSITNNPLSRDFAHTFIDLRLLWESEGGRYTAQAFVTNLTNERSLIRPSDIVLNAGKENTTEGLGRLWGVIAGVKF